MIDVHGELIYIGKAKNLRTRLLSYFRSKSRNPKAGHIVNQARSIIWEPGPDEFAALHRELELIRRWRPRCNVQGQPRSWQHTYICLGRPPAPYAFLSQRPPPSCRTSFGPLPSGKKAQEAVRRINDLFQLRDCPQAQQMLFADQQDLFPMERAAGCLRYDLGTCLGPCAGACTEADYLAQVNAAASFLAGQDLTHLVGLRRAMRQAADQQQFERAAALRDKLTALDWLNRRLETVRRARAMGTVVYPLEGHNGVWRWYLLHSGRAVTAVMACRSDPHATINTDTASQLIALAEARSRRWRPGDWIASVLMLAAWFAKFPAERDRLVPLQQPDGFPRCCGGEPLE
jgi:excinuclease ABC subunit C